VPFGIISIHWLRWRQFALPNVIVHHSDYTQSLACHLGSLV